MNGVAASRKYVNEDVSSTQYCELVLHRVVTEDYPSLLYTETFLHPNGYILHTHAHTRTYNTHTIFIFIVLHMLCTSRTYCHKLHIVSRHHTFVDS